LLHFCSNDKKVKIKAGVYILAIFAPLQGGGEINRHFLKFGEENRPLTEKKFNCKKIQISPVNFNYNCNFSKKYLKNQVSNEKKQIFTFGKENF